MVEVTNNVKHSSLFWYGIIKGYKVLQSKNVRLPGQFWLFQQFFLHFSSIHLFYQNLEFLSTTQTFQNTWESFKSRAPIHMTQSQFWLSQQLFTFSTSLFGSFYRPKLKGFLSKTQTFRRSRESFKSRFFPSSRMKKWSSSSSSSTTNGAPLQTPHSDWAESIKTFFNV
jgi:hypothetical protein